MSIINIQFHTQAAKHVTKFVNIGERDAEVNGNSDRNASFHTIFGETVRQLVGQGINADDMLKCQKSELFPAKMPPPRPLPDFLCQYAYVRADISI